MKQIYINILSYNNFMKKILTPYSDALIDKIESELTIENKYLQISFSIKGILSEYFFPSKVEQKRVNELWKSTCFELFLANSKTEAYYELNFSSSLAWNFYCLSGYRNELEEVQNVSTSKIEVFKSADEFKIVLEIKIDKLNEFDICNIACVLLNKKNERIFYSVYHHLDKADFHNRQNFFKIT